MSVKVKDEAIMELTTKVTKEYLAAKPLMEAFAKKSGTTLDECKFEPLGCRSSCNYIVTRSAEGKACLMVEGSHPPKFSGMADSDSLVEALSPKKRSDS